MQKKVKKPFLHLTYYISSVKDLRKKTCNPPPDMVS